MIVRQDGTFELNSSYPNIDWYNNKNYIIDETTKEGKLIAQIYIDNYPFVDFEHDGTFVTNVIVLDKPEKPIEVEGKEMQLVQSEQGEWEYVYVDIPLTKEQELELKVSNLEQENFNIMLATTEMYEEQYNENMNLMLAITELYEMNMEV